VTQVDEGPESPSHPGVLTFGVPTAGEVLAERYQLQEHINDDAFGRQVWRGVDVVLRRPVAVVLRYPGGDSATEMLSAAVTASRVVHPHLVDVYDAIDEGTRAYVVREWVDGASLREFLAEAPLDPERATTVASAVASAVAALHASGMAHGNIHPGTVMIGSDGRVVLADARSDESTSPDADVRALGAVLYCSLTGHWPHAEVGASSLPDAARDPEGAIVAPRQVRGGVPGHLSDLAVNLLDKEHPPPSADVLAADLGRLDSQRDDEFLTGGSPLDFVERPVYATAPAPEQRRSVVRKLAIGVSCLLVLAIVGLLLANHFMPGSTPSATGAPTASASVGTSKAAGAPKAFALTASQVRGVDPPRGTRTGLDTVPNVVDGSAGTGWKTEHYYNSPNFGGLKPGMGILINLGSPQDVFSVTVQFMNPGATVELKTGASDPGANSDGDKQVVDSYTTIAGPDVVGSTKVFLVPEGQKVQYLLVWISKLPPAPDDPTTYQVGVQDIKVQVR
jgi:hypothetical protein